MAHGVRGAIHQARVAYETSGGAGRIHMNVLWEMGGAERVLLGALEGAKGLIGSRVAQVIAGRPPVPEHASDENTFHRVEIENWQGETIMTLDDGG